MAAKENTAKKTTPSEEVALSWCDHAGAGYENVTQGDLGFPFLVIMQKGSPEVDEDDTKYVEGLKVGDIILTTTKKKYGDKTSPVTVIPVGYLKAFVEWRDREAGGGYVATHGPAVMNQATKNAKGQDVLENGNVIVTTAYFMVLIEADGEYEHAVISMASTQLKKARQWLNIMSSHKMADAKGNKFMLPIFSHKYLLTSTPEANDKGTWLGWTITPADLLSDAGVVALAANKHKEISAGAMQALAPPTSEDIPF